ncbi:MAG: DUF4157 domain-containing protein [Myxococcota bacterium]
MFQQSPRSAGPLQDPRQSPEPDPEREAAPEGAGNGFLAELLGSAGDPGDDGVRPVPLPHRARMEALFGQPFDQVQAYACAPELLGRLGAHAATDGDRVFLSDDPSPWEVAHELAHVTTGTGAGAGTTHDGEAAEREADAAADRATLGLPVGPMQATPSASVALDEWDTTPSVQLEPPTQGENVGQVGIVNWDGSPELRLRATASTQQDNLLGYLPFNTKVQVQQRVAGGWLWVSTLSGQQGYVAEPYVWFGPAHPLPEPNVRLHHVASGESAIGIAEQYYGDVSDDWGQDLRFYVNVLASLNGVSVPSGVDGWRSVAFQAGTFIWVPSVTFARSLQGQVNSGSLSYETLDTIGVAGALERIGQLRDDFGTAVSLSGQYIGEAVAAHAEEAILGALQALAVMAVGAVALLAISTAIGAAIGALAGGVGAAPGAAAGFEVGMALLEWIGLGFLIAWVGSAAVRIGGAFGTFLGMVWEARGDQQRLDAAARQFAEAIGTLVGVLIEALVMWAASVGLGVALGRLRETPFGRSMSESALGEWLGQRVTNVNAGEGPLSTPRDVLIDARAGRIAEGLGITAEQTARLLHFVDEPTLNALKDPLGVEGLAALAGKDTSVLVAVQRAFGAARGDGNAIAEVIESIRLNSRGSVSNEALTLSLQDYATFKGQYGDRVTGDFISRFRRARTTEPLQAEAELQMARDLLAGRSPYGEVGPVEGLRDGLVEGQRTPEYSVSTPEGARLVEVKSVGQEGQPLSRSGIQNNARSANNQIREWAGTSSGETGGLIRLDGRNAGHTDVTPETMLQWVQQKLPSPRGSMVTRYVEILYHDGSGSPVKLTLELVDGVFQILSQGTF